MVGVEGVKAPPAFGGRKGAAFKRKKKGDRTFRFQDRKKTNPGKSREQEGGSIVVCTKEAGTGV